MKFNIWAFLRFITLGLTLSILLDLGGFTRAEQIFAGACFGFAMAFIDPIITPDDSVNDTKV